MQLNTCYQMKKILSEKNIASVLFAIALIVFSFAHEDSKKRSTNYNTAIPSISINISSDQLAANKEESQKNLIPVNTIIQQ